MLLLLPLLFEGILCHGPGTKAAHILGLHHPAAEEPPAFYLLQTSSFANHSWQHTQSSAWVGELQTHRWDNDMGTIVFLRPWSQGNFSEEELKHLQALLQLYFHSFPSQVQELSSQFQLKLKPEAWVSKGPSPGPGRLLLVCHVSGFFPKSVWVRWMRDGYPIFLILICLAVLLTLVMLVVADSWIKKQSSNVNICSLHGLRLNVPTKVNIQEARNLGHQLCLAQKSWMKNSFLNKCKISLSKLR
uniref:CD1e molecule n=1 Tax=Molossus molossus TaxID=27622 RepID=A0A7J8CPT1_MOLMO|nr:CD1e molecule [Molossus molossus]